MVSYKRPSRLIRRKVVNMKSQQLSQKFSYGYKVAGQHDFKPGYLRDNKLAALFSAKGNKHNSVGFEGLGDLDIAYVKEVVELWVRIEFNHVPKREFKATTPPDSRVSYYDSPSWSARASVDSASVEDQDMDWSSASDDYDSDSVAQSIVLHGKDVADNEDTHVGHHDDGYDLASQDANRENTDEEMDCGDPDDDYDLQSHSGQSHVNGRNNEASRNVIVSRHGPPHPVFRPRPKVEFSVVRKEEVPPSENLDDPFEDNFVRTSKLHEPQGPNMFTRRLQQLKKGKVKSIEPVPIPSGRANTFWWSYRHYRRKVHYDYHIDEAPRPFDTPISHRKGFEVEKFNPEMLEDNLDGQGKWKWRPMTVIPVDPEGRETGTEHEGPVQALDTIFKPGLCPPSKGNRFPLTRAHGDTAHRPRTPHSQQTERCWSVIPFDPYAEDEDSPDSPVDELDADQYPISSEGLVAEASATDLDEFDMTWDSEANEEVDELVESVEDDESYFESSPSEGQPQLPSSSSNDSEIDELLSDYDDEDVNNFNEDETVPSYRMLFQMPHLD